MASLCPCPQRVIGGRQGHKGNALKPCNAQCHSTNKTFSQSQRVLVLVGVKIKNGVNSKKLIAESGNTAFW